ncbi:MAG: tRNA (guanine(10)-N(2))-dimethyltransferase [Candidatus Bathyarchaeota archaeon]
MSLGFPTEEILEGRARVLVPKLDTSSGEPLQHLMSEAPVFYNPVMATNRDTAVLALRAHTRGGKEVSVCEPMCGTGVRGIRLALETDKVQQVVMGDLSPTALKVAQANAALNSVSHLVRLRLLDASLLMSLHGYPGGRFSYLDVDPYGSPAPFIDSAVTATENHGLLAATATDMAPLCGVNPRACLRKYGGLPLSGELCHEAALRLLVGALVRGSAVHEVAATPVFSYYADHYVRVYVRLDRGAKRADKALEQMGYMRHCQRCLHRESSGDGRKERCPICGAEMHVGGPMWMGELAEEGFTEAMLVEAEALVHLVGSRATGLVKQVRAEIGYGPGFYEIDKICSLAGAPSIPTDEALNRLREAGFRVTMAHYSDRAIKTDAGADELRKLLGG